MKIQKGQMMFVAVILIVICVIGNVVLYLIGLSPFNLHDIDERTTVPAEGVREIQIVSPVGNVNIAQHEHAEIAVEMKGKIERDRRNDVQLHITDHDERLVIEVEYTDKKRFLSIYGVSYELFVFLPPNIFERIAVEADVADVTVSEVKAENIQLVARIGKIKVNDVEGSIQSETEVGDISINLEHVEHDIKAISEIGKISVHLQQAPSALLWDLRSTLGEQTVDLPATTDRTGGEGIPLVTLQSKVGDVNLSAEGD